MAKKLKALITFETDTKGAKQAKDSILDVTKAYNAMKVAAVSIINTIDKITDKTDNLVTSQKLLASTFGNSTKDLITYVNSLSQMTGLSESAINEQASKFGNISQSLGLINSEATELTKGLTDLSTRLAILYNYDFSMTAKTIVDVMKGASETFTTLTGKVINENTVQNYLASVGIDRTVASLNTAELAIARYLSIASQMNATDKNIEETTNGVAWQKQMLAHQVTRLSEAFGKMLYPILEKVLPILNAVLMVITNIINVIAKLLGYTDKTAQTIENGKNSFDNYGASIGSAADKAKKSLRSFDKLNNIQTPSPSSGAGGSLSIDDRLKDQLDEMDEKLLNIKNKATEIADSIMTWLGFTKNANGEWEFTKVTLGTILGSIGLISIALFGIYKIAKMISGISKLFGMISGATTTLKNAGPISTIISEISGAFTQATAAGTGFKGFIAALGGTLTSTVGIVIAVVAAIVAIGAALIQSYKENEKFRNLVNKTWNNLKDTLTTIWNYWIAPVLLALKEMFLAIWEDGLKPLWEQFKKAVTKIAEGIMELYNSAKPIIDTLIKIIGVNLAVTIASLAAGFTAAINIILGVLGDLLEGTGAIIKGVLKWLSGIIDVIVGVFTGDWEKAWNGIKKIFTGIWDTIKATFITIVNVIISAINGLISGVNVIVRMINKIKVPGWIAKLTGMKEGSLLNISEVSKIKKISMYEQGGFVPEGDLFYANEFGKPEYVGSMNGKTAVANNDQITKGIEEASFQGMMRALRANSGMGTTNVNITAEGDTSGLLDFITFKQQQKDRRNGF